MAHLQVSRVVPLSRDQAFAALSRPTQLQQAWRSVVEVEVLSAQEEFKKGDEIAFRMTRFGVSQVLRLKVEEFLPSRLISLRQIDGSFSSWYQQTRFTDHAEGNTLVVETVEYTLPFGLLGHLANDLYLREELVRLLEKRLEEVENFKLS